ncbi:MAG: SDR family oxidoreductase [Alphaproteobacteria bacterium]|nr:SDR family oxidoreductase [Alphaproteobacteria bacterium]
MKSAVVTGASSGIGLAAAKALVERGFRVFGSVRKPSDAERLRRELGDRLVPLLFDVTDGAAVKAAAGQVSQALDGVPLAGLVNNAGVAVPGPLLHLAVDDFRRQLEINLTGQLIVTQAFAPLLMARNAKAAGRIVMITSVGGRSATPFVGPYNTSKFGLEGFSEALRRELMIFGIDVIVVAPGAVATPIWDKADAVDVSPYADTVYAPALEKLKAEMIRLGRQGLPPEKLGRIIAVALTAAKPKTRYVVTPEPLTYLLLNVLPKRWSDKIFATRLGLTPPR